MVEKFTYGDIPLEQEYITVFSTQNIAILSRECL